MKSREAQQVKKRFGERLRQLRKEHDLSQEDLALLADVDRTYLGGVERGERNISLVNMTKIANALGVSPKEFF